jgi:peptidoglycan/xylan/chitin deacetylase (PgdA/CDA1 family)
MKAALKELLYRSGILALYHRIRNRNTLTVIMFHRVMDPRDPRWKTCDPDYTLSAQLFRQCLELLLRYYRIVGIDDVLKARDGAKPLPARALLLTFDDGWQDNYAYALPVLREMGLPAVIFVVGEAIDRPAAYFQEQIIGAWRGGRLGADELRTMSELAGVSPLPPAGEPGLPEVRRLIAALEALDGARRHAIIERFASVLADGERHNLSAGELREMSQSGIRVGAHGMTHVPLTRAPSAGDEIAQARARLSGLLGEPVSSVDTLSCPHGQYDAAVVNVALQAGCRLIFTSHPALNASAPSPSHLLARVGFEAADVSDASDRVIPARLLTHLFRRPIARLA